MFDAMRTPWIFTFASLALCAPSLATTEDKDQDVVREGPFNVTLPTPECDDIFDGVEKYLSRAAEYTGEWVVRGGEGLLELAQGNPDRFVEHLERTWRDAKTASNFVAVNGGVALPLIVFEEVFKEALPDTGLADFLAEGRRATGGIQAGVVTATVETVEDNVGEIAGDAWDLLASIDDPEEFLGTFLEKNQKWNPAATLTLVFSEGDPLRGAEKATERLLRQADVYTTFLAPYTKAPRALAQGTGRAAKIYNKLKKIPGMPGPGVDDFGGRTLRILKDQVKSHLSDQLKEEAFGLIRGGKISKKNEAAVFALLGVIDARLMADDRAGQHPFYRAELVRVKAQFMGDSYGDGATDEWALWHPVVEDGSEKISLGDTVTPRGLSPGMCKALGGEAVAQGKNIWWTRPIDYDLVWGDNCSGGAHNRSIWAPVAPEGFTAVGFVAGRGSWEKPLPNRIACLRDDIALMYRTDGLSAGLQFMATDAGSGSKYDVTVYKREFAGIELLHAKPGAYPRDRKMYPRSINVPVAWGKPNLERGIVWAGEEPLAQSYEHRHQALVAKRAVLTHSIVRDPEQEPFAFITSESDIVVRAPHEAAGYTLLGEAQATFTRRFERILEFEYMGGLTCGVDKQGVVYTMDGSKWGRLTKVESEEAEGGQQEPCTHELVDSFLLRGRYSAVGLRGNGEVVGIDIVGDLAIIGHLAPSNEGILVQRIVRTDDGPDSLIDSDGGIWTWARRNEWSADGRLRMLTGVPHFQGNVGQPTIAQEVIFGDRTGARFFTTAAGEVVALKGDNDYRPVGRVSDYRGDPQDPWKQVITTRDNVRWLMNAKGELWPEGSQEDGTYYDGTRVLGAVGPVGAVQFVPTKGSPAEQESMEPGAVAEYVRRLIVDEDPEGTYLISKDFRVMEVDEEGQSFLMGRLTPIEHESFVEELLGEDGERAWIDRSGALWVYEEGNWIKAGRVESLDSSPKPATERTMILADNPNMRLTITADNKVIQVDEEGVSSVVGRVIPIDHENFVEEMVSEDGERAWIDRSGKVWIHDGANWEEVGQVLAAGNPAKKTVKAPRYVRKLVFDERPGTPIYITSDRQLVVTDKDGQEEIVGQVTDSSHDSFVEQLTNGDGETVWIRADGLAWTWDGSVWQKVGQVSDL